MAINRKAFAIAASKSGYSLALDHLIPALSALHRGNTKVCARWLACVVKSSDFKKMLASLEYHNQKTYAKTKLLYNQVLNKMATQANDPEILDVQYDLHGVPERLNMVEKGPGIFDQEEYTGEEEGLAPGDRTNEWMISEEHEDNHDVDEVEYKDDQGDNTEAGVSAGLPDEGDTRKGLFENEELLCEFEEEEMVDSPSNREEQDLNEAASLKDRVQANLEAVAEVSVADKVLTVAAFKPGEKVRLKANKEGWPEEIGTFDDYNSPRKDIAVVTIEKKYRHGPHDDGLREVEVSQIEKIK